MPATVIPSRALKHKTTGQTISPFSALPYGNADDWETIARGWTIQWPDGTTGIGRVPFATEQEAENFLAAHPHFGGMNQ